MTAFIEPPRLLELAEAFDLFDSDGTGSISLVDVPRLLKSLGAVIPDAALANLLHHFAQSKVIDRVQQAAVDPFKKKVAVSPNDDFAACLATADAGAGPLLDRDDNGNVHPKLTGKVKIEKVSITLKELLDLLGSGGESDEQREQSEAQRRSRALQDALQLFDVQKNGTVTASDLRKALRIAVGQKDSISDVDIDRIVAMADPDNTGVVDYEDLSEHLFC